MNDRPIPRRAALKLGALAAAGVPVAAGARDTRRLIDDTTLEKGLILLNAANMTPAFKSAQRAVEAIGRAVRADPSFQHRDRFQDMAEAVRGRLARFVNAAAEGVAILRNASEANCVIANGVPLRPGNEVILFDQNHESNLDSWRARATRDGLVLRILRTPTDAPGGAAVVAAIDAAINPQTRVIAISHLMNRSGFMVPAAAIGAHARARHLWFHLDGAQSFGWRPVDLAAIGCTSFSASTHKWMLGPTEAGLLYVDPAKVDAVAAPIVSVDYWLGHGAEAAGARRFERTGQRDDARLGGIAAALDRIEAIGLPRIQAEVEALADRLRTGLEALPGVRTNRMATELSGPIVRAHFDAPTPFVVADRLWRRARVALTPGADSLRFSPHAYNSRADVDIAVAALGEAMKG